MSSFPWIPSEYEYEFEELQTARHRYADPPPEADQIAFAVVGAPSLYTASSVPDTAKACTSER